MKGWTFAALVAASLAIAAPARAATATIAGAPLTVYVSDRGQLQAMRGGDSGGIFYPSHETTGDAGFFLAFPAMAGQNGTLATRVYGFNGFAGPSGVFQYTTVSQGAVTGAGTSASPFAVETNYAVSTLATVKQTTTYVNGSQEFTVHWDVTNETGLPLPYKALVAADFFFEGSDVGTGIFTDGPPRFVGGTNSSTGRSGGFIEAATPWSAWQALSYSGDLGARAVWDDVIENAAASTAPSFDKTVETRATDNAGGVEWDDALSAPLAAHATKSYELLVRSSAPAALQFDRTQASTPLGTPVTFVATAKDTSGTPFSGKALRYSITGPNGGGGAVTIDAAGNGAITDPAARAGTDTITAYVDLNGSGARETNEPQASALASVAAAPDVVAPACTVVLGAGRPGAGKPVTARVKCDSPANLKIAGTLTPAKKRKLALKLPATAAQALVAGTSVPVALHVPKAVAKKYAGAKVTATVTVTATDVAGNRSTKAASRTLTLAAVKKSKHRRR